MTRSRIRQLLDELPADSPYYKFLPASENGAQTGKRRKNISPAILDHAYFDLEFLWNHARAFAEPGRALPMSAQEEAWFNRAWDFLMDKTSDPIMEDVVAMEQPHHKLKRDLVRALLIIPDKTFEEIAEIADVDEEVIEAYEALFFSVRDRMDEKDFIAKIVYPDGIKSEFRDDYITSENLGQLMLKVAHRYGAEPMYVIAGLKTNQLGSEFNVAEAMHKMEAAMMENGLLLAKLGLLNQAKVPGIGHAKSIMVASKQAGASQKVDDDVVGLGGMGISFSIANDILKLQEKDIEYRNFVSAKIAERDAKARGKIIPMEGQN